MKSKLLALFFIALFTTAGGDLFADETKNTVQLDQKKTIVLGQNYPNPAIDFTFINVDFDSPDAKLTVYNVLGEKIAEQVVHQKRVKLDVSHYTEGIYLYTLEADGQKITRRMTVKNR